MNSIKLLEFTIFADLSQNRVFRRRRPGLSQRRRPVHTSLLSLLCLLCPGGGALAHVGTVLWQRVSSTDGGIVPRSLWPVGRKVPLRHPLNRGPLAESTAATKCRPSWRAIVLVLRAYQLPTDSPSTGDRPATHCRRRRPTATAPSEPRVSASGE